MINCQKNALPTSSADRCKQVQAGYSGSRMELDLNEIERRLEHVRTSMGSVEAAPLPPQVTTTKEPLPARGFRMPVNTLRKLLNLADLCSDYLDLKVSSEGIRFKQMDPSHISLVDVFLSAKDVEISVPSETRLEFNIETLEKLVQGIRGGDVTFDLQEDKHIISVGNRRCTTPILEPSGTETPDPVVAFTATITTLRNTLLPESGKDWETITFEADPDKLVLTLQAQGKDADFSTTVQFAATDITIKEYMVKQASRATYSYDYLSNFLNATGSDVGFVTVQFAEQLPMKITVPYRINSTFTFWLAPRVGEEPEEKKEKASEQKPSNEAVEQSDDEEEDSGDEEEEFDEEEEYSDDMLPPIYP
jgi:proliferating cell nuclear antigen